MKRVRFVNASAFISPANHCVEQHRSDSPKTFGRLAFQSSADQLRVLVSGTKESPTARFRFRGESRVRRLVNLLTLVRAISRAREQSFDNELRPLLDVGRVIMHPCNRDVAVTRRGRCDPRVRYGW